MVLERISGHLLILSLRLKKSLGFTCPGTTFLDEKKKISGKLITGTMATPSGQEGNNVQRVVGEGNFMKENKENMSEQIHHTHVTSQKSLRTLGC